MMIDDAFRDMIESNEGCAVICAGSESDMPHIKLLVAALSRYEIPFRVHICSAHKQPAKLLTLIEAYNAFQAPLAFIAVAGLTDALSGLLSYHTFFPVISCPPDGFNESCMRNPSGSSNAAILRPKNAVRFIAQMFAAHRPILRTFLNEDKEQKLQLLEQADSTYRK